MLQQDVRRLLRTVERMGLKSIPMRADTGPIGGDLSHEFIILASTGESEVFCLRRLSRFRRAPADTDFDDRAGLQARSTAGPRSTRRPPRCTMPPPSGRFPRRSACRRAASRSAHLYFGTKYSDTMKAVVTAPTASTGRSIWALRHRARRASSPRSSRRAMDEAGIIWPEAIAPFHVALLNLRVGDFRRRRAPAAS